MPDSRQRRRLRKLLGQHLTELGYSAAREKGDREPVPEIVRRHPLRGRIVYGETVLRGDLSRPACHARLRYFSQRRTRRRSSILFFIGVEESSRRELEALLEELDIRSATRGGHVMVIPIACDTAPHSLV